MKDIIIKSDFDGLELSVLIKEPRNKAKGIVQISHGMAEHKERYIPFMNFLANNGYVVIINDHRGHGKSIRNKNDLGYFYDDTCEAIVDDLHQITNYIKKLYPNLPLYLFGHSMGSMVVRKYIKKYDNDIDKLVICGSPSKNKAVDLAIFIVKILSKFKGDYYRSDFVNKLAFGKYNKNINNINSKNAWICSNDVEVQKYDDDLLCGFTFTLNGFLNLFILMKDIYNRKGYLVQNKNLPIHFVAGAMDPVIMSKKDWELAQAFLKDVGYQNIKGKLYANMRHEILNELNNNGVFKDILTFFNN